jgi:dinuclear metal center YbgI/SA1388 family protein
MAVDRSGATGAERAPRAVTVGEIIAYLEEFAPRHLAADWDNVGLLLGNREEEVNRLMTCLTVTPESAAEAVAEKVQMIVSHHPILFRATQRLTGDCPEGQMLLDLARANVAVYSPHTAYDNTAGGINDQLAGLVGLTQRRPLRPVGGLTPPAGSALVKIVVFVPEPDLEPVSAALFAAGAGRIGEYRECSYRLAGTGTFFATENTTPTIGQKGQREEVSEWRLEVVCPQGNLPAALAGLRQAHSYEEPAYDLYPLQPAPSNQGVGRVGDLPKPVRLQELARQVKAALLPDQGSPLQVVGDPNQVVRRVAVVCGAGGSLLAEVGAAGAEVFLTGELRFHEYLEAQARGLALLLPGHFASERNGVEALAQRLEERWPTLTVWASRQERDPVGWV